jgi:hypothetical protein
MKVALIDDGIAFDVGCAVPVFIQMGGSHGENVKGEMKHKTFVYSGCE